MFKSILITFLLAMVPVLELRGALPVGVAMGLNPLLAAGISLLGNLLPIPFLLLLVPKIFDFLRDKKPTKKLILWLEQKAEKNRKPIEKYGYAGLLLLVAIPLPGTGAWTGALVAACLKMSKKKSLAFISLGVLLAATIVLLLTYSVSELLA